jgi:hypothetical protein
MPSTQLRKVIVIFTEQSRLPRKPIHIQRRGSIAAHVDAQLSDAERNAYVGTLNTCGEWID